MGNRQTNFTVIGAGHGGKGMAAHLALQGFPTTLYSRTAEHVAAIKMRGGIDLDSYEGGPRGFGRLAAVTSDMEEALEHADVVRVVIPSTGYAELARLAVPHLRDGQVVLLNPGPTGGALEFVRMLRECEADVTVAEAETLLYASRSEGPAQARIFRIKEAVPIAALPATRSEHALEALAPVLTQFIDGVSVLHTSLNNMGPSSTPR